MIVRAMQSIVLNLLQSSTLYWIHGWMDEVDIFIVFVLMITVLYSSNIV